jgi:hypothetical protein
MVTELEQLKKENEYYKKKLAIGEHDLAHKAYLSFVSIVQQQVDYLSEFSLKSQISALKKDSSEYERAESIIDKLPTKITQLNNLKAELKIEYDAHEGVVKTGATSPQNIHS